MGIQIRSKSVAFRCALCAAASGLTIGFAGPALAQSGASDDNEIIVTAQFREQRLQDTPLAITALSGDALENKALNSIVDVAATAPNVNIQNSSGAYGGPTIYIRGVGQYDSSFAYEQGVGLYIDDIYHGVLVGSLFDLLDLERVEILRGPQGTLAGKNSIGGAVKMFSRTPQGDGSGYLTATYGSYDRMELRGAYDLGLSDNLSLRVSGFTKRRDGHVKRLDFDCDQPGAKLPTDDWATQVTAAGNCQIGTLGGTQSWGLRAALRFAPTDNLEINIAGSISRERNEVAGIEQTSSSDPRFEVPRDYVYYGTFTTDLGWNEQPDTMTNFHSISGRIDYDISDSLTFTSITSYEDIYSTWLLEKEGGPAGSGMTKNISPYHQFTQEIRLSGEAADGALEFTVGGFYFDSKGYVGARLYDAPVLNWIQNDPVTNTSKSVFAHVVFHPVENMSIIGGVRYTDDRKTYQFVRLNSETGVPLNGGPDDPLGVGALNSTKPVYEGDSLDYRLGLDYRFSDELMAYVNFSTGYKGGGVNPRPYIPTQAVPFNPERVDAYEIGFKSDLADNMVRLNVSAFLNKYNGIILIDANGYGGFPLSSVPFNAGKADVKGFEVETTIEPVEGLTFQGSLSYLDFQYKELDSNATESGMDLSFVPPFTPKWRWSAEVAYEIPLSGGSTLTPRFFADYTDSYFTDPQNRASNFIGSRTMLNANITYVAPGGDWELIGGVTNLTDKHYYFNAFDLLTINGNVTKSVGRPREFYVTVKKNF